MGGSLGIVHITTLNGVSLAWFLAASAWGGHPLTGGARPIRLPSRLDVSSFARPSASPLLSFLWSRFLVVLPGGWLCAAYRCRPVFFDSLCARYAQRRIICSQRGGSCARLTMRRCRAGRAVVCGVAARVGWGSSGVLLGCERGRVSVLLALFFEDATMPKRGAVHQGRGQAHLRLLLNERTMRHRRVNVDVPVQERYGNREGQ